MSGKFPSGAASILNSRVQAPPQHREYVISILGDSLSLPLRKRMTYRSALIDSRDMIVTYGESYPAILQRESSSRIGRTCLVTNNSERGAVTTNLLSRLAPILHDYQPDYLVINIGTSDARYRRKGLRRRGGQFFQRVPIDIFRRNLSSSSASIATSRCHLITIGILPASAAAEKQYPGIGDQFTIYNDALNIWTTSLLGSFISFDFLGEKINEYIAPDGFHYLPSMHRLIADKILGIVSKAM